MIFFIYKNKIFMIVYLLSCPDTNEPKYIGKTKFTIQERIKSHITESKNKSKNNKRLAWIRSLLYKNKYPNYEILELCDEFNVNFWEKHYISLYRSWGFQLKNSTDGGDGHTNMSQENRNKLSDACKKLVGEKNHFYGKKHSDDTKKFLSERIITEETKNKLSISVKKAIKDGKINNMGINNSNSKKIIQYDLDMNIVKIWDYITEVEQYGFTRRNVHRCLSGETHKYKGFIWKYLDSTKLQ